MESLSPSILQASTSPLLSHNLFSSPDVRNLSPLKINKASEMFRLESLGGRREGRQKELVEEESGTPGSW